MPLTLSDRAYTRAAVSDRVYTRLVVSDAVFIGALGSVLGSGAAIALSHGTSGATVFVNASGAAIGYAHGTADGTPIVNAAGSAIGYVHGTATGEVTALLTGSGAAVAQMFATATATTIVYGTASAIAEAVASATGTTVAFGAGAAVAMAIASADGVVLAIGAGAAVTEAHGSATGTAIVHGAGATIGTALGTAAGVSLVLAAGASISEAHATAAGVTLVNASGASIVEALGTAEGSVSGAAVAGFNFTRKAWGALKPPAGTLLDRSHPLTRGLVFFAPFNEGAGTPLDLISGTRATMPVIGWGPTRYGAAYDQAGGTGGTYVRWTNVMATANTAWTMAVILRVRAQDSNGVMIASIGPGTKYYQISSANDLLASNGVITLSPTLTFADGRDRMVVMSNDGSTSRAYINGTLYGTASEASAMGSGAKTWQYGAWSADGWDLDGRIAAGWVWDRVLSATEVRELSQRPFDMMMPRAQ